MWSRSPRRRKESSSSGVRHRCSPLWLHDIRAYPPMHRSELLVYTALTRSSPLDNTSGAPEMAWSRKGCLQRVASVSGSTQARESEQPDAQKRHSSMPAMRFPSSDQRKPNGTALLAKMAPSCTAAFASSPFCASQKRSSRGPIPRIVQEDEGSRIHAAATSYGRPVVRLP